MANEGRGAKAEMKEGWVEYEDGVKRHYVDNELHSINDEPSMIYAWGYKAWFKEGLCHRELGPARIWPDGEKEYWFEGNIYSEITSDLEWIMKVEELKRK